MKTDLQEEIAKPRSVALYMSLSGGGYVYMSEVHYVRHNEHWEPLPEGEHREQPHDNAVRITEPVELQLAAIGQKEMVKNAVDSLNEQERKVYREMNAKLAEIKEQRNQLLALTHQPEESHVSPAV